MTLDDILAGVAGEKNYSLEDITRDGAMLEQYRRYVNFALRDLVNHGDWPWLYGTGTVTTVANADDANLPDDFTALRPGFKPYYANGSAWRLNKADGETLTRMRSLGGDATTGQPYLYELLWSTVESRWQMSFYPRPGDVYDIRITYRRRVPTLIDRNATPAIPPDLHELLTDGASAIALESTGQEERGMVIRARYEAGKKQAWSVGANPARGLGTLMLSSCDDGRGQGGDGAGEGAIVVSQVTAD